jgi:hypothetical protein
MKIEYTNPNSRPFTLADYMKKHYSNSNNDNVNKKANEQDQDQNTTKVYKYYKGDGSVEIIRERKTEKLTLAHLLRHRERQSSFLY